MAARHSQKTIQGFAVHTLSNEKLSVSMVPELGGRVVSMRDRVSGREWLDGWAPAAKRRLWHPTDPADFASGPGAGIDECLPTVLPCQIDGENLSDHGELWNVPAFFDESPAAQGALGSRWNLKALPLDFERRISVRKDKIHIDYRLTNRADAPTPFLWAWHGLFAWKHGDQIRSTEKTCRSPGGEEVLPWPEAQPGNDLSRAFFPKGATPAAKVFLGPLSKGRAEIHSANGAKLSLSWPAALFPYAGIWITRGFWKGLHHWAIEPTNAPVDRLSDIMDASTLSLLAPREVREWTVIIGLSSETDSSRKKASP
jgi:galactose mutarotase-like enzyme